MEIVRAVMGLLWAHGVAVAFGTVVWGVLFAVVGVLLCVGTWIVGRRLALWNLAAATDRWLHWVVLGTLVVLVAPVMGCAGLVYGAERATLAALQEERAVARICRGAALHMIEPALREVSAQTGEDFEAIRVPVAHVRALRSRAQALADQALADLATQTRQTDDIQWLAEAKLLVAGIALRRLREDTVGAHDAALVAYLDEVTRHADANGTVGAEDFTGVLAARYLEPPLLGILASLFASLRYPIYLGVVALLAIPFGVFAAIRFARNRRAQQAAAA